MFRVNIVTMNFSYTAFTLYIPVYSDRRQKESGKLSRNVHSTKPELRHHQQSCLALTSTVPSATDSLELEMV